MLGSFLYHYCLSYGFVLKTDREEIVNQSSKTVLMMGIISVTAALCLFLLGHQTALGMVWLGTAAGEFIVYFVCQAKEQNK